MGGWVFPTTADIGIRCFGSSEADLFEQAAITMQDLLISDSGRRASEKLPSRTGFLSLVLAKDEHALERLLILLLEEILFRAEVEDEWITALQIQLRVVDGDLCLDAGYEHVDGQRVEREIEIKAVTRHRLCFAQLDADDSVPANWSEVPQITGPGWYCDVIFDI